MKNFYYVRRTKTSEADAYGTTFAQTMTARRGNFLSAVPMAKLKRGRAGFYGMSAPSLGPAKVWPYPKEFLTGSITKEKEPLELYHITSRDPSIKDVHRVNFAAYTEAPKTRGPRPGRESTEEEKEAAAKL